MGPPLQKYPWYLLLMVALKSLSIRQIEILMYNTRLDIGKGILHKIFQFIGFRLHVFGSKKEGVLIWVYHQKTLILP